MKKESSVKELIKLEQDFELRVSKEEMNYMGCPKTDHFETVYLNNNCVVFR